MKKILTFIPLVISMNFINFCTPSVVVSKSESELSKKIKLPKGFKIDIFAQNINNARSLARGTKGTIFIGTRSDSVYALIDKNNDNKAEKVITIASGLNMPNGVAFKDGDLYVAEINRILKYPDIENRLENIPKPIIIADDFPKEKHHGWKYISFGPDGKLYIPVGAPCNICKSEDPRFASITRMNKDGTDKEVYVHGVRNSVGFDWNPKTNSMFFTDNGRDMLGDDMPPDELNMANKKGLHFGYPFCHGGYISDPEFGSEKKCSEFVSPVAKLGAHVASLGIKFYKGNMFPKEYQNKVFIAEHGSWNRSKPIGYRITMLDIENDKASNYKVFAEGWLNGSSTSGRPVDILNMPDGSLLVSDDAASMVYRISYKS
ncbi:MAG: PQQ-dependent sugar dehydrogenase [Candidatus Sericytochromatia bacterium]